MQDWVAQALDRIQPILDGIDISYRYLNSDTYSAVEREAMSDILERVEWLAQHFKVLPEPCHGTECQGWYEQGWRDGLKEVFGYENPGS